mmetsp:Transcript_68713/g.119373  ORF Transcript_68713/g.119373 Transcript_68713/m.119373 type:complete len:605 (+) Transcript_68713:87-1901(+)
MSLFLTFPRFMACGLSILLLFAGISPTETSSFLGRLQSKNSEEETVVNFVGALLQEIEGMLQGEHHFFTEKRITRITEIVSPIFEMLPKNEFDKLGPASLNEALHRIFTTRHAWMVKGLAPWAAQQAMDEADDSNSNGLGECLPQGIASALADSTEDDGLGLFEIAILVATVEHLVHKEAVGRLQEAFKLHQINTEDVLSAEEVDQVMDTYLMKFITGDLGSKDLAVGKKYIKGLDDNVREAYPPFKFMQTFLRDVEGNVTPNRDHFYFSDAVNVVEAVSEKIGHWQHGQCQDLKSALVQLEDKGTEGAGRVHLGKFYNASLSDGKWSFTESVDYLRWLGALDETDPERLRLIIPNYIHGPSNCVGSSAYYSVCCISECEGMMVKLQEALAAPEASAEDVARVMASLSSSSTALRGQLSRELRSRLDEIAAKHDGTIPLHGRQFAHWMHLAYPRECPYVSEMPLFQKTQPEESEKDRPKDVAKPEKDDTGVKETVIDFAATKEEMLAQIENFKSFIEEDQVDTATFQKTFEKSAAPSKQENPKMSDPIPEARGSKLTGTFRTIMRYVMFVAATGAAGAKLMEHWNGCKSALRTSGDLDKIKELV